MKNDLLRGLESASSNAAAATIVDSAVRASKGTVRPGYVRPIDFKHGRVDMTHGSGGRATAQLVDELFLSAFDNVWLRAQNDSARIVAPHGRMVIATDSHVISPLFFPGGDIGCLSVHGTINDVAMAGAKPLYLAATFVLEEGFPLADLRRIVYSMADAARAAGVPIVTGDTKVVEQGKGDGVFITTTGIGVVPDGVDIAGDGEDHFLRVLEEVLVVLAEVVGKRLNLLGLGTLCPGHAERESDDDLLYFIVTNDPMQPGEVEFLVLAM